MKITPNQRFIHNREVYEEGQEYDVSDELGFYFKGIGWLVGTTPARSEAVTLDVHNGEHGHESEVK